MEDGNKVRGFVGFVYMSGLVEFTVGRERGGSMSQMLHYMTSGSNIEKLREHENVTLVTQLPRQKEGRGRKSV